MAKDTRDKLINSALTLFSQRWYETVSVAEICRHSDLSNGVFYRYFESKEELFRVILEEFMVRFAEALEEISGETVEQRLGSFISIVNRICFIYPEEVTIFREGQYRFPGYEEKLREMYMSSLGAVYLRAVDEGEYLYIVSGLRFLNTRSLYDSLKFPLELTQRFITRGVFPGTEEPTPRFVPPAPVEAGEEWDAEGRLIQSGIRLFGSRGFSKVNVFEIAREADLSVGAFYLYFPGKEQFLSRIVSHIGHSTRYYLRNSQVNSHGRLNQELEGMWNFVNFFQQHPEYYEIVREAEFVSKEWVRDYYNRFSRGYERSLTHLPREERNTAANFLMGLSHYLGIESIFHKRIEDLPEMIQRIGFFLKNGIPE